MSDVISLRGLRAEACHGVLAHEKVEPQPFLVDLDARVDVAAAGASDALGETVSYADLAHAAHAVLTGESVDLIETLAERIAAAALAYARVRHVRVTVHKPQAPIGLPVTDASVTVERARRTRAVVALGANLSAPAARLADAVRRLHAAGAAPLALSPIVETDPVGGPDQGVYLNAVAVLETDRSPRALLDLLHEIEAAHHRTREVRWGPRTLDLDLVAATDARTGEDYVSADPVLTLPHPRAAERAFVLVPWLLADPAAEQAERAWTALAGAPLSVESAGEFGVRPGPAWPDRVAALTWVGQW